MTKKLPEYISKDPFMTLPAMAVAVAGDEADEAGDAKFVVSCSLEDTIQRVRAHSLPRRALQRSVLSSRATMSSSQR